MSIDFQNVLDVNEHPVHPDFSILCGSRLKLSLQTDYTQRLQKLVGRLHLFKLFVWWQFAGKQNGDKI